MTNWITFQSAAVNWNLLLSKINTFTKRMKFGFRIPSLNKRIAARTSVKRMIRHNLGLKAPRGMGWITDPKKAMYNRVYNRTSRGCLLNLLLLLSAPIALVVMVWIMIKSWFSFLIKSRQQQPNTHNYIQNIPYVTAIRWNLCVVGSFQYWRKELGR